MSLPGSVRAEVTEAIRRLEGGDDGIATTRAVSGGCINHGVRVDTAGGRTYFLKWNPSAPAGMFEAEADGLLALHAAAAALDREVRPCVPRPLATGEGRLSPANAAWLLTDWLSPGRPNRQSSERLGRGLALLHDAHPEETIPCGWDRDNWIGSLPQANSPSASWADFWRDQRIVPQLERARGGGFLGDGLLDELLEAIPAATEGVTATSLLHGDLWSGNTYVTDDGRSALVDPAVYRGDGEVDLAMTELFGGFGASFYDAYEEVRPITAAYRSHRRALYQLYYLLVHVNLFGAGYEAGCRAAARTVVAEVG